jgi:hypothetical protein
MSFISNATSLHTLTGKLSTDAWSGFVEQAQAHTPSNSRLIILGILNVPVIIVLINVLLQLVCLIQFVLEQVLTMASHPSFVRSFLAINPYPLLSSIGCL